MPDFYTYPPADHEVADIVGQLSVGLENLPDVIAEFEEVIKKGTSPGDLKGITKDEFTALYRIARKLYDDGDFIHALPVCMQLMLHNPKDSRHSFLTAACLQRLKEYPQAAVLFACTLHLKPEDAAAAFRLGECLMKMGQPSEARQAFDMAIELSRCKFQYRQLQELAEKKVALLQQ